MRSQERTDLTHSERNSFPRLLPGEHTHFCVWREHRAFHGDGIGVSGDFVRQDQNRILAAADEIACHSEDEVGAGFEHLSYESVGGLLRDLGPLFDQRRSPGRPKPAGVRRVQHLRPPAYGLR